MDKKKIQSIAWVTLIGLFVFSFTLIPATVSADAVTGETVVTLGQDLTPEQKQSILQEMDVDDGVKQIEVTNEEEHQYLGNYLSKATIGTQALSSAKITMAEEGTGIQVQTNNITTITEQMYTNALITAGIKDANVYVTAPVRVSGTAGLTGILKAFEAAADQNISEEQKQVANEEMVRTSELGEKVGKQKAAEFMNRVKQEIAEKQPQTEQEIRDIIVNVAGDLNINLNNQDVDQLTQLLQKFSELNIDWDSLRGQLNELGKVLQSEEAQGFFDRLLAWLSDLLHSLKNLFSS
ncbi:DUF1002 domain-containing protein [Paludifilum halophilum]|uniref:DUF1002 domain-containing protein n=1 Tax=Paludifilum halophilum TaxID=1642702 RepID=A0A235B8K4_9BACL|nr:DUF1002 domain-containing protein [Paludifilum halophilum]OYD08319.1 hypothetical protein CHM34_05585 [Paludifilum halophilum]